jgi:hypothetical protein
VAVTFRSSDPLRFTASAAGFPLVCRLLARSPEAGRRRRPRPLRALRIGGAAAEQVSFRGRIGIGAAGRQYVYLGGHLRERAVPLRQRSARTKRVVVRRSRAFFWTLEVSSGTFAMRECSPAVLAPHGRACSLRSLDHRAAAATGKGRPDVAVGGFASCRSDAMLIGLSPHAVHASAMSCPHRDAWWSLQPFDAHECKERTSRARFVQKRRAVPELQWLQSPARSRDARDESPAPGLCTSGVRVLGRFGSARRNGGPRWRQRP